MVEQFSRVLLLAAMSSELKPAIARLSLKKAPAGSVYDYSGRISSMEIIAAVTTMGTRASADKARQILEHVEVDHVFVVGIAGANDPNLAIGDLIIPEAVINAGDQAVYVPQNLTTHTPRGKLYTTDELQYDRQAIIALQNNGVSAIDMETGAIAAVCAQHHCPFSVYRAISDRVEQGKEFQEVFELAAPGGSPDIVAALHYILRNPRNIPYLLAMGLGARKAITASSNALLETLNQISR